MFIPLYDPLSIIYSFRHAIECLGAAKRGQTSVNELLRTIGFGRRAQEGLTNSRQGTVDSLKFCSLTTKARRLRERLDTLNAYLHLGTPIVT